MMFHWVKILVSQIHDLSFIPGTYMVERGNRPLQVFLLLLYMHQGMSVTFLIHICKHMYVKN